MLARPWINGSEIVETSGQNIILVTFNYRIGLYGFLAGADVKNDGNLNAGLLDQRFVFEWVQRHISKVRVVLSMRLFQSPLSHQEITNPSC